MGDSPQAVQNQGGTPPNAPSQEFDNVRPLDASVSGQSDQMPQAFENIRALDDSQQAPPFTPLNLLDPSQAKGFISGIPTGFGMGAAEGAQGIARLGQKVGIPVNQESMQPIPQPNIMTSEGAGSEFGKMMEGMFEFLPAEAGVGAGLTAADKALAIGKIMKAMEVSPPMMEALKTGMRIVKGGATGAGLSALHGGSGEDIALSGAAGAAYGAAGEIMGRNQYAQANSYIKTPEDYIIRAFNPAEPVDLKGAGQSVQPSQSLGKFDKELRANIPYIMGEAIESGRPPQGRRDVIDDSLRGAAKFNDLYYNKVIEPMKDVKIGWANTSKIPNYQGQSDAEGNITLGQLDKRLGVINATLNPRFEKSGMASIASLNAETIQSLQAEAAQIRNVLYPMLQDGIGNRLGIDVADVKSRAQQMKDIADYMEESWQATRRRAFTPVGDESSMYRATERGIVKLTRATFGDPRDADIRHGWAALMNSGIEPKLPGMRSAALPPPPTNIMVERHPSWKINIADAAEAVNARPTGVRTAEDISHQPDEVAAQKAKIEKRADEVLAARARAIKKAAEESMQTPYQRTAGPDIGEGEEAPDFNREMEH